MHDETPAAPDAVILEPGGGGTWTHRYGSPPDGYGYRGKTVCCERPAYFAANTVTSPHEADSVIIDDCCETPGVPKPVVLPPYSGEHATCRKCGSKAVETKYTRATASPYGIGPMGYPPEWLARRCAVCQVAWDESTVPDRREPRAAQYPAGGALHALGDAFVPTPGACIMQLGCPLCAEELSAQFEMPPDAVMRSMLNVRDGKASHDD